MGFQPDFIIDNEILTLVSEISILVNRIPDHLIPPQELKLRHENRIRSIHSSLAIEGNTLSLREVTNISKGKPINVRLKKLNVR